MVFLGIVLNRNGRKGVGVVMFPRLFAFVLVLTYVYINFRQNCTTTSYWLLLNCRGG